MSDYNKFNKGNKRKGGDGINFHLCVVGNLEKTQMDSLDSSLVQRLLDYQHGCQFQAFR